MKNNLKHHKKSKNVPKYYVFSKKNVIFAL